MSETYDMSSLGALVYLLPHFFISGCTSTALYQWEI